MAQTFAPERALAQHCAELTARDPRPEERAEVIAAWRRDVGKALSERTGVLLGGARIAASLGEPEWLIGKQIFERIGPVAANSLLRCGGPDQQLLLSVDLATTIALTDRSFGGTGEMPQDPLEQLTRSAGLLIDQLAAIVAESVVLASGEQVERECDVIFHRENVTRLKPFGASASCAAFKIELGEPGGSTWHLLLAATKTVLDSLLPGQGEGGGASRKASGPTDGGAAHLGAMPLPIEAVLTEFDLPLSRLERLAPGDSIPIAMPREIPLRIGAQRFAHGNVGTFEDRLAIRLTRIAEGAPTR
ncbi:FliM/FliN family flagellar motor switch protein [Erythrobacter sp. JK5]|uniref:FliM/FliN family flagellar motor switch protein n=1 Tax=Erythrobacter sp. JK5 TaxID=2829500 RepID=UPI001BABF668|nr:flagellar motor switch protein FliM [Erythrobacter sp. JK5]QUL36910.1 FliM/FliN family flagellar motor switch protein [Erythrobacter sp. JK5]